MKNHLWNCFRLKTLVLEVKLTKRKVYGRRSFFLKVKRKKNILTQNLFQKKLLNYRCFCWKKQKQHELGIFVQVAEWLPSFFCPEESKLHCRRLCPSYITWFKTQNFSPKKRVFWQRLFSTENYKTKMTKKNWQKSKQPQEWKTISEIVSDQKH